MFSQRWWDKKLECVHALDCDQLNDEVSPEVSSETSEDDKVLETLAL